MIFLETFVFKSTSHPKSASPTLTAMSDFFPKNKMSCMYVCMSYIWGEGAMTFTCSAGKYHSLPYRPLLFCFTIIMFRNHNFPDSITEGSTVGTSKFSLVLILLIIISSVQNSACEVDCTDHYYIAFFHNALPALIQIQIHNTGSEQFH